MCVAQISRIPQIFFIVRRRNTLVDASLLHRRCLVTLPSHLRYMLDICSVYVRYLSGILPNIYRTYTGQVPDKYIACNMVSSWLHLRFNSPAVSSLSVQGKSGILHVAGGLVVLNIQKKLLKSLAVWLIIRIFAS